MAKETFTSYTEVDPGSAITVAANTITWTELSSRADDSYVYYDFGANYFSGDFTHKFKINVSDMDTSIAFWFPWALANSVNDMKGIDNAGESFIAFGLHNTGTFDMYLYVCESGNLSTDNSLNLSLDTDYYITVNRDDSAGTNSTGLLTAYICTGAHYGEGGTVVDTLVYNCKPGSKPDFRYLYATNVWATEMDDKDISGTVSDMELENVGSTTTTSTTTSTTSTTSSTTSSATASTTSSTASTSSTTSTTSSTTSTTSSTSTSSTSSSTASSSTSSSTASSTSTSTSTASSTSSTASTTSTSSTTSSTASSTSTTTTEASEGADSEIWISYLTGKTLFACRFKQNGSVFVTDGSAAEPWGTGSRDADNYDVAMTEQGTGSGHYTCQFDESGNISAGIYRVAIYVQAGANPTDTDVAKGAIGQGECYWDGTSEITLYSLNTDIETTDTSIDNMKKRFGHWA